MSKLEGWPWPSGTLVTGIYPGPLAMSAREQCRDHIWVTVGEAVVVEYGCGWIQSARCIVCDYTAVPIDALWWALKPVEDEIARCLHHCDAVIERMEQAKREVLNREVWAPLRSFE
jgi:hypothetical protein